MVHWSPLALTAHGAIKSLGDYAGFAALLAVALLVLLYFAQARELKRVSEWAAREAERPPPPVQVPVARPAAPLPPPPASAAVAQRPPGGPVVAATVQGVRRVQIPALAATDTTTTATSAAAQASAPDATTIGGTSVTPPAEPPTGETPDSATAGPPSSGEPKAGDDTALAIPPAAEAPADPLPAGAVPLATPIAERAVGEEFPPAEAPTPPLPPAPEPPAPRLPPAPHKDSPVIVPPAAGGPRLPPPPGGRRSASAGEGLEDAPRRRHLRGKGNGSDASRAGRRRLAAFAGLIVLVAVAVVVFELTGSSSPAKKASTPPATGSGHSAGRTPTGSTEPGHSSITVAVLNGTDTPDEAGKVSATLTSHGYVAGRVADAPNQATATTVVGYTPGHKAAAEEVVRSLALAGLVATPIDTADEQAASAQGTTPQVVVVIGANYTQ